MPRRDVGRAFACIHLDTAAVRVTHKKTIYMCNVCFHRARAGPGTLSPVRCVCTHMLEKSGLLILLHEYVRRNVGGGSPGAYGFSAGTCWAILAPFAKGSGA